MKKALRIGYHRYYRDDHFREHLRFIERNLDVIDEITLFAEFSHYGYWDLDFSQKNAALLKERIQAYRDVGVKSVGINLLCTIGHLSEGWEVLPRAPFLYQVNQRGEESRGQLCFMGEDFLRHVANRYTLYAQTGADFIWMDDDIRVEGNGCFCAHCVSAFNEENQTDYSREELASLIGRDPDLRKRWLARQHAGILRLIDTVRESVQQVDPKIKIGYMSISGNRYGEWVDRSRAEKGRPGGGFYDERTPLDILKKCFRVQRQIACYPSRIQDIQYEYEAFNYQTLNRSLRFSEWESTLALMSGCTGVLYNQDIFYDRQNFLDMMASSTKKWQALAERNATCLPAGIFCTNPSQAKAIAELGIPITAFWQNASASFILGADWDALSDEEIQKILTKGVLTDGLGVEKLCARGFSASCGASVQASHESGMAERFGTHAMNGEYANYYRDVFMSFTYYINNKGNAYEFAPQNGAQTLSNLETITHEPLGCSLYVFENDRGERFAADGYLFPNSAQTHAKREQLLNVLDWVSGERLPARVRSQVKVLSSVTANEDGGMNILLTNASLDDSGRIECRIRSARPFYAIGSNGELLPISQRTEGKETVVTLESLRVWESVLLTNLP